MDPQIRARLVIPFTLYPCTGYVDGDKQFGEPIQLNGYVVPKHNVIITIGGEEIKVKAMLYIDTDSIKFFSNRDEVDVPVLGRIPVKAVMPYPSLGLGYELAEVAL